MDCVQQSSLRFFESQQRYDLIQWIRNEFILFNTYSFFRMRTDRSDNEGSYVVSILNWGILTIANEIRSPR
jgi:hypothetical protein